jgi:hypothetical protein
MTCIRVQSTEHQRHQARLAAAVLAGYAYFLAAEEAEAGTCEQDPGPTAQGDVIELQHEEGAGPRGRRT